MAMKGVLPISQSSSIGASPSDCLVSYPENSLLIGSGGVLFFCRDAVSVFYSPSQQSAITIEEEWNDYDFDDDID